MLVFKATHIKWPIFRRFTGLLYLHVKTYKWTDTSKELLIEALSDENIKNEILGFELNNITENQDGVDEATGKLTQISHSISDKACKTLHKSGRKKKKNTDNRGQIM